MRGLGRAAQVSLYMHLAGASQAGTSGAGLWNSAPTGLLCGGEQGPSSLCRMTTVPSSPGSVKTKGRVQCRTLRGALGGQTTPREFHHGLLRTGFRASDMLGHTVSGWQGTWPGSAGLTAFPAQP